MMQMLIDLHYVEPVHIQSGGSGEMVKRRRITAALVGLACAGSAFAIPALAATSDNVSAGKPSEFRFTLAKKSVKAGSVTFKVTNNGSVKHDFSIGGKKT